MPKLIFTDKTFAGRVYELVLEKTTVGRGEQNTLVIHESSLSAAHCEILVNGPEVLVLDLNSRNGTFVNGVKLHNQQSQLLHGQIVRFGTVAARLELDGMPDDRDDTDITAMHAYRNIKREQKRAPLQHKPSASRHLDSDAHPNVEGPTLQLQKDASPKTAPTPSAPDGIEHRTQPRPWSKSVIVATVVVLGLLFLVWFMRRKIFH